MSTKTDDLEASSELIPLTELGINNEGEVAHIDAGRNATQRLSGMGITLGTKIRILSQAPFHGPIQIKVRQSRIALGRGLARKIFIVK